MDSIKARSIDEYIVEFPDETRELLVQVRATIHNAAPEAVEVISYQMPAFQFHGILVYFAGYKNHIGFYPTPSAIVAFQKELSLYHTAKGSIRFPIEKPLPLDLITKIVEFRVQENKLKAELKIKSKKLTTTKH